MDTIGVGQKYCNEIISKVHKIGNNLGLPGPALEDTLEGLEEDVEEETGVAKTGEGKIQTSESQKRTRVRPETNESRLPGDGNTLLGDFQEREMVRNNNLRA